MAANRAELIRAFAAAERSSEALTAVEPAFEHAKVKLTDNCNSKCVTCDYWKTTHENELTLDELLSVVEQLGALGVREVMFTGGEPTMRAELPAVVRRAAQAGFETIGLTTNGLSLTQDKLTALHEAGLTQLVLSLEGLTLHDEIRGVPGNTAKILRHLDRLSERRARGWRLSVKLAATLMEKTFGEVGGLIELARAHRAVLFVNLIDRGTYFFRGAPADLMTVRDRARLQAVIDTLVAAKERDPVLIGNTFSSLEYARRYFDDPKQAAIPCHLGYIGVDVDANGDVYSNCWGLPPVGNVRRAPLADILKTAAYRLRCQAMFRKECPGCSCGYILNLAYHKPSVELDARYGPAAAAAVGYAGTQS
jgi:MoaA/NifB/PqqE/SkfB family radical SAM enzyme